MYMKREITSKKHNDRLLILLGFTSIGILFLVYSGMQDFSVTDDSIQAVDRLAIAFYIIMIMSFGAISYGLYRYHHRKVLENSNNLLGIIASITLNNKARKIFVITFIIYWSFFSVTSGMLIYQPDVIFSHHYDATIPSAILLPCCGEPGYMPKIIVYMTEHIGLQIIPINLVLQIIVSYLVAFNVSLALCMISFTKKGSSLAGIGATTGLFIACPTCVGTFLTLFISSSSAIIFTLTITQIQTFFIAITIPILLITPIIIGKKIQKQNRQQNNI